MLNKISARYTIAAKAAILREIKDQKTYDEALQTHMLSNEELQGWYKLFTQHGLRGLRASKVQDYRRLNKP